MEGGAIALDPGWSQEFRNRVASGGGRGLLVSSVGDYQSAIQLVVRANLAFFTFPELRQPSLPRLEVEMQRWAALLQAVPPSDPVYDTVLAGALRVRQIRQVMEERLAWVRTFCLTTAAIYALLLLWTCHAANRSTDGLILEFVSGLGAFPAAVVAYLNISASRRLVEAGASRRRFEREFRQGTPE